MIFELAAAFEKQTATLRQEIVAVQAALATEEDREQAAIFRATIASIENLIAKIDASAVDISRAETSRVRATADFARWRELVREIRASIPALDHIAIEVQKLDAEADQARDFVQNAQARLSRHHGLRLGPLALERERARYEKDEAILKEDVANKIATLNQISAKRDALRGKWFKEKDRVGRLSWQENQLRPPELQKLDTDAVGVIA